MGIFRQNNAKEAAEVLDHYQRQFRDLIAALPHLMANGEPTPKAELTRQCDIVSSWMGKTVIANGPQAGFAEALADTLRQTIYCLDEVYVENQSSEALAVNVYSHATTADFIRAQLPGAELKPVQDAYFYIGLVALDNIAATKTGKLAIGLSRWCASKDVEGDLGQPPIPLAGWYWDPEGSNRYRRSDGTNWTNEFSDNPHPE